MLTETVQAMINKLAGDLNQLIENQAQSVRERIIGSFAGMRLETLPQSNGMKPRGHIVALSNVPVTAGIENGHKIRSRKPRAVFLCLRKNCKNVGAPIYGMVCTKHKDTPKATIAKLKAARAARAEK